MKALLFFGIAFVVAGCGGGGTSSLCSKAVECEYIDDSDHAECVSDIENAIEDEVITAEDVNECDACVQANQCGLDTLLDCSDDCQAVASYVFGAQLN